MSSAVDVEIPKVVIARVELLLPGMPDGLGLGEWFVVRRYCTMRVAGVEEDGMSAVVGNGSESNAAVC